MTTPFGKPAAPAADGDIVRLDDLHDRLVLIQPKKLERVQSTMKNDDGTPKPDYDRITADIIVLDGRPRIGGETVTLPKLYRDVWLSGKLVGQLREYIDNAEQPYALGRFGLGEQNKFGRSPRILEPYDEDDVKVAMAYFESQAPAL